MNDENVPSGKQIYYNSFESNKLQKTQDCIKVLRGKNKKYTQNLRAEILWQTLLRLFGISLTNILLGT